MAAWQLWGKQAELMKSSNAGAGMYDMLHGPGLIPKGVGIYHFNSTGIEGIGIGS